MHNGQGLAAVLRAFANATELEAGRDSKTQKRPISHARSAVGYNPVFGCRMVAYVLFRTSSAST
jgi:hypothetical protein